MIVLFGLLTACGGGGGNGTPPPVVSTLTFQFKSAWGAYQQQNTTFPITLSGTVSNGSIGSYAITGSGTVQQTWGTEIHPAIGGSLAIKVTRVYQLYALANNISITQTLTDVAYYDPTSYAYLDGTFTDNTGSTINNVPMVWMLPPDTLACCSGGATFYQTGLTSGGPTTHNYLLSVAADTANSVFINLTDNTAAGANRSYRLDSTNTLTPVTENINAVVYVVTTHGTYPFNAAVTFNY